MPPRRAPVARRAPVSRRAPSARTANNPARNASTTTDAPMSVAAINQLIKTRVAEALTNQEQLRNNGGTEGVVGLTQWFEKMESVFHISNCTVGNQVKFATCTLLGATRPKTMQEAIKLANDLMDQKVRAYAEMQAENKLKTKGNLITTTTSQECKFYHHGPCTVKCTNCKKVSHMTRDCWIPTIANNQRTITCYECGNQGHYRSDFPELRNRNHGNQAEDTKAHGVVYALGGEETDQDPNKIEDEIEAQEEDFLASTSKS
ncbi:reverse transcriptase domain-containing protein [Tanacetum coccineum]